MTRRSIPLYRLDTFSHGHGVACTATHTVLGIVATAEAATAPEAERRAVERLGEAVIAHLRTIGPNAGLMDIPEMERAVLDIVREDQH